jgi:menaquinone-dependent protoporphyrinogen oxidase
MRVLVAYATKSGSTAGIAEAIADELRKMGVEADVHEVSEVRDLAAYGAVVLGSAVYIGRWRKEALRFGSRFSGELSRKPVWLFESGPTDASADEGKAVPAKAAAKLAAEIGARQHVIFGGKFAAENVGDFTRRMIENGDKSPYGDFRNFDRIRGWARAIGAELQGAKPVEAVA